MSETVVFSSTQLVPLNSAPAPAETFHFSLLTAEFFTQLPRGTRQGALTQGAEATRKATDATGHKIATQHTTCKPQGFIIRPPLLTTNNFFYQRWLTLVAG